MGKGGGHTTNFSAHTLQGLKDMVRDAQPDKVEEIASHWMHVHDQLAGDAPDGSVQALLDKAVADVLEYWHGDAADSFAARARELSTSLKNGALYAKNTCHTLQGAAAELRDVQRAVMALQDTVSERNHGNVLGAIVSGVEDGADWMSDFGMRDDSGAKRDVANGMSSKDALAKHRDTLSRGREIALQAAVHMERLGASYNLQASHLGSLPPIKERGKVIPPPDTIVPPPVVMASGMATASAPRQVGRPSLRRSGGRAASAPPTPAAPLRSGAPSAGGGSASPGSSPTATPKAPTPGTALDGVRGGLPTPVAPPANGSTGEISGGVSGGGSGPGTVPPGVPGAVSGRGPVTGGRSLPGARTTPPSEPGNGTGGRIPSGKVRGTEPAVSGQTGKASRLPMGTPGTPGVSGGGRGSTSGGKQGGLARRSGGVVGEPSRPGTPGRSGQGGSGLHRSRGGALGSRRNVASDSPVSGAVPTHGRSSREERRKGASRPDYLVEDEETWIPQRDVVPGVVGEVAPVGSTRDTDVSEQHSQESEKGKAEGMGEA